MKLFADYKEIRQMLLDAVTAVGTERVPLELCGGRVLAEDLKAIDNVPPFDRSPYDGYAFRSADISAASEDNPVTLTIIEEVPAGAVPTKTVTEGTATKILTGAPIPEGADAVINYEVTEFTDTAVKFFAPVAGGQNIIRAGDDVKKGTVLAEAGTVIDAGLAGSLAAQHVREPLVYRKPRVGIISTGDEVVEPGEDLAPGKIINSNRYTLTAALQKIGCEAVYMGVAGDKAETIANVMTEGLKEFDAIVSTGGVSVGDYDLTPAAMELAGMEIMARGVDLKPGQACAYGTKDGKVAFGFSGNPVAAVAGFYIVALPAFKKLAGRRDVMPEEITVTLTDSFGKKSDKTRLLWGYRDLSDGTVKMGLSKSQGNVTVSGIMGCDCIAFVPKGSGKLDPGTVLEAMMID